MFARAADRLLDLLWDWTLAVSSKCAVCAFWRGIVIGQLVTLAIVWLKR